MAIGCLRIGLDDTDAPGGLCTTWLGAVLALRLEAAGVPVHEHRLVRLNPNAPFRTRGNAAIALVAEGDPALAFEMACAAAEEFAPLDEPMTNPGVVVTDRPLPGLCYTQAVTDLCTVDETLDALDDAGALYRGYGNGRGLIGAAAAVAAEFPDRTYELLAYRERSRWGSRREVDAASLFRAEASTFPRTWDSVDPEAGAVVCVPHTPDPVLFGIRGESPDWVAQARLLVVSEPVAFEACWTTNQGTDAHLVAGQCGALQEGRSYAVEGTVADQPTTGPGGHVTVRLADGGDRLRCMAYEPTKGFRGVARALRPGDRIVACGSYRHGSLNLEKLSVLELAECTVIRPPLCPACGRRTTSAGRDRGWKCRVCGTRTREPEVVVEARVLSRGWYEVPPSARRHLARPLCRGPSATVVGGLARSQRDREEREHREGRQKGPDRDRRGNAVDRNGSVTPRSGVGIGMHAVGERADADKQRDWWNACYREEPALFGPEPSFCARMAAGRYREGGRRELLELGAGHGRDTIFFAGEGFRITALDYADKAVDLIEANAVETGLEHRVKALRFDVREPLPFPDGAFDGVYAHMLLCMELSVDELGDLTAEVRRILRPGGVFVYTVRHTGDAHATIGAARPDGCREHGGFVVRFFDRALVERLGNGYALETVEVFNEGELPRRLWCVVMHRGEER